MLKKVAILFMVGLLLSLVGCGGGGTQEEESQVEKEELLLTMEESAEAVQLKITILRVIKTGSYPYQMGVESATAAAGPGNKFIIANVEIENIGDSKQDTDPLKFSATDAEGSKYDRQRYFAEGNLELGELSPGQKITGKVQFKVPDEAEELRIICDFGSLESLLAIWELEIWEVD